jgi:hypothetical protein
MAPTTKSMPLQLAHEPRAAKLMVVDEALF